MTTFSCYLIGGDTLLVQCAEHLLDEGHDVRGVVTSSPRIEEFCRDRGVATIEARSEYAAALRKEEFDYLFAITHLAIIPDEVLELPREFAVNFHDGPLPRYAGLNTPVWALLNQEAEYGITWHVMTTEVDEGDVLEQRLFDVSPDETALSLNTRCMAAAVDSFPALVRRLAARDVSRTPQDLSKRSYFGRLDRPPAGCLIDWCRPSGEIDAFVRALSFGPYRNPVGVPKSWTGNESSVPFVVGSLRTLADDRPSSVSPGDVLRVDDEGARIATGDGVALITQFMTLGGRETSAGDLGLAPGARLEHGETALAVRLSELDSERARHEGFWRRRLEAAEPAQASIPQRSADGPPEWVRFERNVPETFRTVFAGQVDAAVLTALGTYLARTGRRASFSLPLVDASVLESEADVGGFYSRALPLQFDLQPDWDCRRVIESLQEELGDIRRRGGYLRDLVQREPALLARATQLEETIGVVLGELGDGPPPGSLMSVTLDASGTTLGLVVDAHRVTDDVAAEVLDSLTTCLWAMAEDPGCPWTTLPLLSPEAVHEQIVSWNETDVAYDRDLCVHQAFEQQADRTPDATAVTFEGRSLSYRALDERSNQLAHHLGGIGVGQGSFVGVNVSRSLDLAVATLAILKAGAAYVPLDPDFPADRLALMIEDSHADVVITQRTLAERLPESGAAIVCIDADWGQIEKKSAARLESGVTSSDLAYAIYTSGSTGHPKGVLVEHRNVVNFFVGMDAVVRHESPGVWLAVTSLSFDISVLELFWTLARGFTVVLFADRARATSTGPAFDAATRARPMDFGLFMWGNDDGPGPDKYRLMLEGARFFDENGFDSVWTPERHFHAFGGPFPNPSVTSAAIAAVTKRIGIRSGSCVSPLHHPIRVAEEWSVVDNLSGGRVGLSFAAGWQPNDFVLRPESFPDQKKVMFEQMDVIRRLWRGEAVEFQNPLGKMVPITTLPRPVQPELPIWITTAGNPDSYRQAGSMGANVLTHLLGQTLDEVAGKIDAYREARAEAGFDPDTGVVSLMLHAFVGDDDDEVREIVRQPMKDYLGASMKLVLGFAWSFPAFKRPGGPEATPDDLDLSTLSDEESDAILTFAFERYFETSGLFGTADTCQRMVDRCKAAGVDEIACLLDFGVDTELVMQSLPGLKLVRDTANLGRAADFADDEGHTDQSFAAQVARHGVTHLQCTPSMLRLLLADSASRTSLGEIRHLMIGGEAFPTTLAEELAAVTSGSITNMYGPTETTIWSSTQPVDDTSVTIPIGRPIANTRLYVLDQYRQPLPCGIPGELYIGGDGVTRGYHEREALTEERFVVDHFRAGGARMYRTGDLTRLRRDGAVEFLGRADHQVKIRGYRIELGEIEAVVEAHADVVAAAVLMREDEPGDQRLVAYVVPSNGAFDEGDLRDLVRRRLPEYMAPAHYVPISRMPLTPNGKTDRRALASRPLVDFRPTAAADVLPEGDLEVVIAEAWKNVLRVERIGVEQNFFDVGGHSLLVVQLHRKLSEGISKPISLVDLYRFPTIRALATHVAREGPETDLEESESRAGRRKAALGRRRRGARGE